MAKADIEKRVGEMLKLVKLEQFAKRKPHQLSGGQRQRRGRWRARWPSAPRFCCSTSRWARSTRNCARRREFELVDLQYDLGLTFIVVTHDQEEAMTMADRIAILDKGEVVQVATPAEIYEAPGSRFVADFVGTVNLIEGELKGREKRRRADRGRPGADDPGRGCRGRGDPATGSGSPSGRKRVKVSAAKPDKTDSNAAEGEIYDIAYLGDMTIFHIRLDDGRIVKASTMNSARVSQELLTWHDRAWISFRPDAGVVLTR